MAAVTQTRYTPEDLQAIDDRPMPELIDGKLVAREMGQRSEAIAFQLGSALFNFIRPNKLGIMNGLQCGYQIFADDPDKVRTTDVSFTRFDRLVGGKPATGHARVAPDLAVEVVRPNDKAVYLQNKIGDFQAAGIRLIWIVYPESRTVMVQRQDGSARNLKVGDVLDGENVLPGFRLEVASIFE